MKKLYVSSFKDLLPFQGDKVEIVCIIKRTVVRALSRDNDIVHLVCADGTKIDLPLGTPIVYEPWVFDRGSLLFEVDGLPETAKLCTEDDIARYPNGDELHIVPNL